MQVDTFLFHESSISIEKKSTQLGGSRKAMSESVLKEDRRANCAVLCQEAQRKWPFIELLVVCSKHTCVDISQRAAMKTKHGQPRNMTECSD